jgi:hypothetical protein
MPCAGLDEPRFPLKPARAMRWAPPGGKSWRRDRRPPVDIPSPEGRIEAPIYDRARLGAGDHIDPTRETCSSGTGDLEAIGEIVTGTKVVIAVIDHHTLQIERPDQVADIIRAGSTSRSNAWLSRPIAAWAAKA